MSYPGTVAVKTPPADEPLTLEEVKLHLRVDHDDEDALIERLLRTARQAAEGDHDLALITQTLKYHLDNWPSSGVILLPRSPVREVSEVKYVDLAGDEQIIGPANYELDIHSRPGRLRPTSSYTWPHVKDMYNAITITYDAGWGDEGVDVPEEIRQALLLMIGNYYEHRETVIVGTISSEIETVAARNILESFRTGWGF